MTQPSALQGGSAADNGCSDACCACTARFRPLHILSSELLSRRAHSTRGPFAGRTGCPRSRGGCGSPPASMQARRTPARLLSRHRWTTRTLPGLLAGLQSANVRHRYMQPGTTLQAAEHAEGARHGRGSDLASRLGFVLQPRRSLRLRTCSAAGMSSLTRMWSPSARSSTFTGCARHAVPAPNTSSRRPSAAAYGRLPTIKCAFQPTVSLDNEA